MFFVLFHPNENNIQIHNLFKKLIISGESGLPVDSRSNFRSTPNQPEVGKLVSFLVGFEMNFVFDPSNNDRSKVLPLLKMRVVLKNQFVVNRMIQFDHDRDGPYDDRDREIRYLYEFRDFHWLVMK